MLNYLKKSEIQSMIGSDFFMKIADFIDKLSKNQDSKDQLSLYKRDNQIKLLLATAKKSQLQNLQLWQTLFNRLSQEDLNSFSCKYKIKNKKITKTIIKELLFNEMLEYGISVQKEFFESVPTPASFICFPPEKPFKTLKDYQVSVYKKIKLHLENPRNRFIVQMPTGAGKTRTAMEVVCEELKKNKKQTVLWIAHTGELLDQAATCFCDTWVHLGNKQVNVSFIGNNRKGYDYNSQDSQFVICSFKKMYNLLQLSDPLIDHLSKDATFIVIDEAHLSLAPTYKKVIDSLMVNDAKLMGLTATPGRGIQDNIGNKNLSEYFFENIVQIDSHDELTVFEDLRRKGILSNAKLDILKTSSDINLSNKQLKDIGKGFDIPNSELKKLGEEELRNLEILDKIRTLSGKFNSILLFACSINQSKFLSVILRYLGISAEHLDGNTHPDRRKAILKGFREGSITVLSNYGVLSTGFDAPKTDVVFLARPTKSIVLYSQMIGRGLRGPNIGGTEFCLIVNVVDNIVGLPAEDEIYSYFDDYFVKD